MRLKNVLLFSSAVAVASLTMATRDSHNAVACDESPTISAICDGSNDAVDVSGCYYWNCSFTSHNLVYIYNNCNSDCTGCTYVTSTYGSGIGPKGQCSGQMSVDYSVNCQSPNQGYVCAKDTVTGNWSSAYWVGDCQCI